MGILKLGIKFASPRVFVTTHWASSFVSSVVDLNQILVASLMFGSASLRPRRVAGGSCCWRAFCFFTFNDKGCYTCWPWQMNLDAAIHQCAYRALTPCATWRVGTSNVDNGTYILPTNISIHKDELPSGWKVDTNGNMLTKSQLPAITSTVIKLDDNQRIRTARQIIILQRDRSVIPWNDKDRCKYGLKTKIASMAQEWNFDSVAIHGKRSEKKAPEGTTLNVEDKHFRSPYHYGAWLVSPLHVPCTTQKCPQSHKETPGGE